MLTSLPPETNADGYVLTFDKSWLQPDVVHGYLSNSYWSKAIPREIVEQAMEHSMCVGIYLNQRQVAFARLITDYTTFGYLCDVFVLEEHQGKGLAKWMLHALRSHPDLQRLRRWMLATADAHTLYTQFGFTPLTHPERFMQIHDPSVYQQS